MPGQADGGCLALAEPVWHRRGPRPRPSGGCRQHGFL